ncbi:MAG: hypothetical protein OHK0029_03580 [Armatimonadaceae bacterium]
MQETWRPRVSSRAVGDVGELVVNDVVVIRFRSGQGGYSATGLAIIAANRLNAAIARGAALDAIEVQRRNPDNPALTVGGETIVSAPVAEPRTGSKRSRAARKRAARAAAVTRLEKWAAALRRTLTMPGLIVKNSGLVVPLGENRTLQIAGPAQGPITVVPESGATGGERRVSATVDPQTGGVTLQGLKPGREVLTLYRDGAMATVYVAVRPYAANVRMAHTVTVTGSLVPASLVNHAAVAAAQQAIQLTPGAKLTVDTGKVRARSLRPGQGETVAVPIRVTGDEMLPVERTMSVAVVNRKLPDAAVTTLLYSNNPERVPRPQTLFVGEMPDATRATRLLYHHQSDTQQTLLFTAELINYSDRPAKVHLVGGDAGPERDTVWVGYRAASEFVSAEQTNTGLVLVVPPRSRVPLSSRRLPPGLTISGLMQMHLLEGPPPLVRVATDSLSARQPEMAFLPIPSENIPSREYYAASLSQHVYANPTKKVEAEYTVGGGWTFLKFGRFPLTSAQDASTVLHGNYGVFYEFAVNLKNPTDQPSRARVVFEPSAGLAGGVFLIGDRRVEIPQINMPREHTLGTYSLEPGESRSVHIRTMPVSGSNYPATIIVRP